MLLVQIKKSFRRIESEWMWIYTFLTSQLTLKISKSLKIQLLRKKAIVDNLLIYIYVGHTICIVIIHTLSYQFNFMWIFLHEFVPSFNIILAHIWNSCNIVSIIVSQKCEIRQNILCSNFSYLVVVDVSNTWKFYGSSYFMFIVKLSRLNEDQMVKHLMNSVNINQCHWVCIWGNNN